MIKKIIFDLDNTLIMWDDKFWNTLNEALDYYKIEYDQNTISNLIKAVDNYEDTYDVFDMKYMKEIMEDYSSLKLPDDFVYKWTIFLEKCYPNRNIELEKTLEYLSNKYELVVLTNWFTEEQKNRLKNFNILKYFKDVIGTEKIKNKPNKEAYLKACYPYKVEECIMIGDSIKKDIEGAIKIGMKAIHFDFNKTNYSNDYKIINDLSELKDIL